MITCTRRIEFDAAHRVMRHESKCKYLHGHRYGVEATFTAGNLDNLGRVIDFGMARQLLGTWIDEHWDHATILSEADHALGEGVAKETGQTIFYLSDNPTAENMAQYLLKDVCPKLFAAHSVRCIKIRIYETPNCYAEVIDKDV